MSVKGAAQILSLELTLHPYFQTFSGGRSQLFHLVHDKVNISAFKSFRRMGSFSEGLFALYAVADARALVFLRTISHHDHLLPFGTGPLISFDIQKCIQNGLLRVVVVLTVKVFCIAITAVHLGKQILTVGLEILSNDSIFTTARYF
jgi:hypothetical protein